MIAAALFLCLHLGLCTTPAPEVGASLRARAGKGDGNDTEVTARTEAAKADLSSQALDRATERKDYSEYCRGAGEGRKCIPGENAFVYCSAGRQLSRGAARCERRVGHLSRCVGGGVGLTRNYCDDPFCRNGGAYRGPGKYCHKGSIVLCTGDAAPRVIDSCPDRTHTDWNGCRLTEHFTCKEGGQPYCSPRGTDVDCNQGR